MPESPDMTLAFAPRFSHRKPPVFGRAGRRRRGRTTPAALPARPVLAQAPTMPMLQMQLEIGKPNDALEQEAERVADVVMRMPASETMAMATAPAGSAQPSVERCGQCAEEDRAPVQRTSRPDTLDGGSTVPPIVHQVLSSPGRPLDPVASRFMETRFGHDFSQVRVHTDARAAESAKAVAAQAYTVGTHVVFDAGRLAPQTTEGRRLLAHELVHVLQQGSSLALQRYEVPSDLPCADVAAWIGENSPYKPEWAQTACEYTFQPQALPYAWKPRADGTVEVTVKADKTRTVSVSCPIDRPEWSPDARPNQAAEAAAFRAMREVLDAHEAAHQKIGKEWRGILESRFQALTLKFVAANETEAPAKVTEEAHKLKTRWTAEAQAAQDAIDPFRGARLTCP